MCRFDHEACCLDANRALLAASEMGPLGSDCAAKAAQNSYSLLPGALAVLQECLWLHIMPRSGSPVNNNESGRSCSRWLAGRQARFEEQTDLPGSTQVEKCNRKKCVDLLQRQEGFEQLRELDGWGNARDVDKIWKAALAQRADRVVEQPEGCNLRSMQPDWD